MNIERTHWTSIGSSQINQRNQDESSQIRVFYSQSQIEHVAYLFRSTIVQQNFSDHGCTQFIVSIEFFSSMAAIQLVEFIYGKERRIPRCYLSQYHKEEFRQRRANFDLAWAETTLYKSQYDRRHRLVIPCDRRQQRIIPAFCNIAFRDKRDDFKLNVVANNLGQSGDFLQSDGVGFRGISGAAATVYDRFIGIAIRVDGLDGLQNRTNDSKESNGMSCTVRNQIQTTVFLPSWQIYNLIIDPQHHHIALEYVNGKPLDFKF